MTQEPEKESGDVQIEIADSLTTIAEHLKSIRSMLSFFVVITLVTFGLGACNILLSI